MPSAEPVFIPDGQLFLPTPSARGPWDPSHLHGSAVGGLLARALDRLPSEGPMVWTRVTVDLLRPAPCAAVQVVAEVTRPGTKIQGCRATALVAGTVVAQASAMRLRKSPTDSQRPIDAALGSARTARRDPFPSFLDEHSFCGIVDLRWVEGDWSVGPASAWLSMTAPLVAGEANTSFISTVALADWAHGLSQAVPYDSHVFMNTDLTVYLEREPIGAWVGLDANSILGAPGVGIATSRLYDEQGAVGRGQQSLFVEQRELVDLVMR